MRLWVLGFWCALVLCGSLQGMAQQQQTGPRTLETLLKEDGETQSRRPSAVDASAPAAIALPTGRIQGAVARPKDGVQHPDLDAAWREYEKQIEEAAKGIEEAIEAELSKAAAAGDLDAALKWKTAGEHFKKDGRIPEGLDGRTPQGRPKPKPIKPAPNPQPLLAEAQGRLAKAYEAVEKELVKSLDLERAEQVRAEKELMCGGPKVQKNIFLAELVERAFNAGHQRSFAKGSDNSGKPLAVRGVRAAHGIWLHPPTNGFSAVTFDVPEGTSRIVGSVAMNDSTQDQATALTFIILDDREKPLWKSKPIHGRGAMQAFDVPLGKSQTVTLLVQCPGDWRYAHAVWVDPHFRKDD